MAGHGLARGGRGRVDALSKCQRGVTMNKNIAMILMLSAAKMTIDGTSSGNLTSKITLLPNLYGHFF